MSALLATESLAPPPAEDATYVGVRTDARAYVVIRPGGYHLPLRTDLRAHSPSGFEWGYSGSGPAQLALAMIAHATHDDELALRHYLTFACEFIAALPRSGGWSMTVAHVRAKVAALADAEESSAESGGPDA